MTTHITNLKEHILLCATKLAKERGIANIQMRMVAKESGIASGTIYNYYPTKGDLIAAIVEEFWKAAFQNIIFENLREMDLVSTLEQIYKQLLGYLNCFKENWLEQLAGLDTNDKNIGRNREKTYLTKIYEMVALSLEYYPKIVSEYTSQERLELAEFIFSNMMMKLRNGDKDLGIFRKILEKALILRQE